jgi:hypothetical protein
LVYGYFHHVLLDRKHSVGHALGAGRALSLGYVGQSPYCR